MVRHATTADIATLVELGRSMHAEAPVLRHAAFSPQKVEATLRLAMEHGLVLLNVDEDGSIDGAFVGVVIERWFSTERYFADLAFYVKPERRGGLTAYRLLRGVLAWCEAKGLAPCDVTLAVSTGVHPETTGRLFEQMGFERYGGMYRLGSY
jgi:GNAT superfamily N-acetyltransferase